MTSERLNLTLILGGVRSGKSDYALELAQQLAGDAPVLFIATAQAGDEEMTERIVKHQAERPDHWQTLEAPTTVGVALHNYLVNTFPTPAVLLLDCLTLWVSNVLFDEGRTGENESMSSLKARMDTELDALLKTVRSSKCPLIVVSNEVGLGIVPMGQVSRNYRDLIGYANRRLARIANKALFLVAGIPLDLKVLQAKDLIE